MTETRDLIQSAQDNNFTEFEPKVTEILNRKIAQKLNDLGYFREMDIVQDREDFNESEDYKEFYKKMLKKFGVKSPAELDEKKKKEFFKAIQDGWTSEDEKE